MKFLVKSAMLMLSALVFSNSVFAEDLVQRAYELSDISEVYIHGNGSLEIRQGNQERLEVVARESVVEEIIVDALGEILRIRPKTIRGNTLPLPITYRLTLKKLSAIKISGDIHMKAVGTFQSQRLDVHTAGASKVEFERLEVSDQLTFHANGAGKIAFYDLRADYLEGHISGATEITFTGEVAAQTLYLSGVAKVYAQTLKAQTATLNLSGAVNAKLWVTKSLDVNASGASELTYFGSPTVSANTSGVSSVTPGGDTPSLQ